MINVKGRKLLVESEAKKMGLWVGGNVATSFDIAALFVSRCSSMYLTDPKKSAWILIGGALKSKAWKGLHNSEVWKDYTAMWDLGSTAFDMGISTCVVFLGIDTPSKKIIKKPNTSVKPSEFLSDIGDKIKWADITDGYPKHQSGYAKAKKTAAKNGASLFPYNLVRIKDVLSEKDGEITFNTLLKKGKWDEYGSLTDTVPKRWIKNCIYSQDIYPYVPQTHTLAIIPMNGSMWDGKRDSHPYWKKVSDIYVGGKGPGKNTPPTLEKRLDHNKLLSSQLEMRKWLVVYNQGGYNLYAMKVKSEKYIIEHGCFYIPCESENEADYITAMLNAPIMAGPITSAKTSDLYYGLSIWHGVPIPRFEEHNPSHMELVQASKRAGQISKRIYHFERKKGNRSCNWALSSLIRQKLKDNGISDEIDALCQIIVDEHYMDVSETGRSYWDHNY